MSESNADEVGAQPIVLLPQKKREELFTQGQALFNDGKFFEAHEAWEILWKQENGRDKDFVQGLIALCGLFVHVEKKNWSGAKSVGDLAQRKLSSHPSNKLYKTLDTSALEFALGFNLELLNKSSQGEPPEQLDKFVIPKLLEK